MLAEWETHEGTWLAWPHNVSHWPGKFEPTPLVYVKIIRAIAESEKVFVCVNDQKMEDLAKSYLKHAEFPTELMKNVFLFHIPTDASWSRDHGPIFVRDTASGKLLITDWIFNAWGDKYRPYAQDDVVPQHVGKLLGMVVVEPKFVLEGGSIEVNGQGTLLTTEQCLLNKNRNPQFTREQIEDYLNRYLGAKKILWLKEGIMGDDTDGHIDDIARFVAADTVVCAVEENPKDENYKVLQECYKDLQKMTDQDGKLLKVIPVPMPEPVIHDGERLPASYVNFLITNKSVLVPTFRSKKYDTKALKIIGDCFPDRKVVGIDCWDFVWGLGTIHCSTQQQPRE